MNGPPKILTTQTNAVAQVGFKPTTLRLRKLMSSIAQLTELQTEHQLGKANERTHTIECI